MFTHDDSFELVKKFSRAIYCTPDTKLRDLGIEPLQVFMNLVQDELVELNHDESNAELYIQDEYTLVLTKPIFKFDIPISEIDTLESLADEICNFAKEQDEYTDGNGYDFIQQAGCDTTECGWYTLESSWEYSELDHKALLSFIKVQYGIQIEKATITKFNGTLSELCEVLTDRINRAILFQNSK